jgi:hypothetical protein
MSVRPPQAAQSAAQRTSCSSAATATASSLLLVSRIWPIWLARRRTKWGKRAEVNLRVKKGTSPVRARCPLQPRTSAAVA